MPLTPQGAWSPIMLQELRQAIVALWKAAYGDNADTDPNTPDGLEINLIAMSMMLAFDANTGLWSNSFFRSALGVSLDRWLDVFAKVRDPAEASTAVAVFYGDPNTPIPAASVVITNDTSANRFASGDASAIGDEDNSETWVGRIIEAQDGVDYLVSIDANLPSSYTAGPSDTVEDIAAGLAAEITADGFATSVAAGLDADGRALLTVDIIGGEGDAVFSNLGGTGTPIDGLEAGRVLVTATETGPLPATAGTLTDLATPITGVVGVTNDADASIGRDEESDDAFRARHLQTLFANSARTDGGMRNAVAMLAGVEANLVRSNRDEEEVDGRPPHSVENIILKTETNPADDAPIADAIARQIPAGIKPYGLRSFGFGTTVDGEIIEVFATDVAELYLHLNVIIVKGEGFPTGDLESATEEAIANYFDAGLLPYTDQITPSAVLEIGGDWRRTATNTPINAITQNASASITITSDVTPNPGDVPVFAAADQPADDRQIIRVDKSRINVSIIIA